MCWLCLASGLQMDRDAMTYDFKNTVFPFAQKEMLATLSGLELWILL